MSNVTIYSFNWVDYCFIAVIILSLLLGLKRGFIREVVSLIIWILALILPIAFSAQAAPLFSGFSDSKHVQIGISFVAIFLIVFIIGLIVNFIMRQVVSKAGMSGVDRFAGIIFGLFRGLVLLSVFVAFMNLTVLSKKDSYHQSVLVGKFDILIQKAISILPEDKDSFLSSHQTKKITEVANDNAR